MSTEELRQKAKELGIKGYHKMHDETLISRISEFEAGQAENVVEVPTEKHITGWLYHKEHTPRIFSAGSEIPPGWSEENRKYWTFTDNGEWIKVNG
jgi:hypothetical protein